MFSDEQRDSQRAFSTTQRLESFCQYWVQREAVRKAIGGRG
ncbi:MAG: hypothetical protein ACK5PB_07085 [Pirellula sp.]